jgi:tetratricopeptide (TPR) repeat protein
MSRSLTTNDPSSAPSAARRYCGTTSLMLLLASTWSGLTGCQSLHKRLAQRTEQCGALCAQARAAREQGHSDQANQYINEALRQKPSDGETRRQLAETMWNNGRKEEAAVQFGILAGQYPKDSKLAARLAVMQWETDQHLAAASTAEIALQLDPQSKEAWLIKARAEAENGKLDDALVSYIRLSQVAPDDLPTLLEMGELHVKRGHPDRACPLFRTAMLHPQATPEMRGESEWRLGTAYASSERWTSAVPVLERAIALRPASADDWCFLGWVRMQSGDLIGAQSDLERAFSRDPNSVAARKLARQLEMSVESAATDSSVTPASYRDER